MIRVLIERHIAESLESAYEERSRRILQGAVSAPGFVSGETLVNARDPNHRITLANWRSEADWDRWYHSRDRQELLNDVKPMMDQDEKITILHQC
ncbi:antibiotic biosynthesis monooxygenase [Marinobacter bryozoorum]|jgi:antibiotic biosynthesis monooxygenase (ABM) superfamily enzyme|uniref:antibiotic biosynthesis monooxygenase family protein n=1 Tax=Marinobacter bryozoorum TaxID=256324 RepID=UPI0020049121|nr:antibiotic biosynthesis monooxygenase [Marinobacter bryozoorum]MCK7544235.1 antibiotic biosynthesis monooxygenase [Marinobacter bryozoorum]